MQVRAAAVVLLAAVLLGACGKPPSRSEPSNSVSPSTGAGAGQIFTAVFSDPKGAANLESARVLINEYVDGRRACFVYYVRQENAFLLVNDNGYGSTRMKAGDSGELSNSQCLLAGTGSSASVSGNLLKVVLDLRFKPAFVGKKQVFLATRDISGKDTEFRPAGSWRVTEGGAPGDSVPSTVSVAPASGDGWSETFTFTYSSPNGPSELVDVRALFNRGAEGTSACFVEYDPATSAIALADDASQKFAGIPLKSGQVIGNSQCSVNTAGSSVSVSGSALIWKLAVTFKPSFAGRKNVYLYAMARNGNDTGMQKRGTWAVPYGSR